LHLGATTAAFLGGTAKVRLKTSKRLLYIYLLNAEFLRGNAQSDECEPLFQQYKKCLAVWRGAPNGIFTADTLQVALKERGIDKLLEEAREDAKETDQIHMRPRCAYMCCKTLTVRLLTL